MNTENNQQTKDFQSKTIPSKDLTIESIDKDLTFDGYADTIYSSGRSLSEVGLYTLCQFMPNLELENCVLSYNALASVALTHKCFNVNLPGCIRQDSNGFVVFSFGFPENNNCQNFLNSIDLARWGLTLVCYIDHPEKPCIDDVWHKPRRIEIHEVQPI